ncbi:MAG TPA: hypothetical protein DF296_06915 [Candidatus Margulisbacteria bacterium]|nr:MAG: hypothetical protein A2X41_02080 [Candidatus Margulisbacteria bacterium GWE2_39_32]HCT84916.1 hypothetical protein [Candidatus Margulisiibacteriota bacterium]
MLEHDKKLDNNEQLSKQADYYETVDSEEVFDFGKAIKKKGEVKRVNMVIPFDMYLEAMKIGEVSGTGYQNTLKMAMAIGLKQLHESVTEEKEK